MPRMAGLLGGTYIVMNRCEHRATGFGLGGVPNHNALLYDLTKPVNSRMSAMANTIVARLYHPEAIVLLDEQVLGRPASQEMFLLRTLSSFKKSSKSRSLPHHISCAGTTCTIAPPNIHVCPPSWFMLFVLDSPMPSIGVFVRISSVPVCLSNQSQGLRFGIPGV
jgi:hypothetical protein